jgi:catechol 2,3-dioxygenase-like lactoylglutathione lyase family enzyme
MSQASRETPRVVRIDHLIVGVTDWDVASDFYHRVLGAEVVELEGGRVSFRFGDTQVNVHGPGVDLSANVARIPVAPGNSDLCLHWSGSIEEAMAHLARHDVPIETGPVERPGALGAGTSIYFRDPDGSLIEFISYDVEGSASDTPA